MVNKAVLDKAKAFLCWDTFPDISVQLIETQKAVSYFHPPAGRSTIIVYYERGNSDFSFPLFLLFHEAGHYLQYREMEMQGRESEFWRIIDTPTGPEKAAFEKQAWEKGREAFKTFVQEQGLEASLLKEYDKTARKSIRSYR